MEKRPTLLLIGSPEPALLTWFMHCLGSNQFAVYEKKNLSF